MSPNGQVGSKAKNNKIPEYIMSNSEIIIIFQAELKENLIFRQKYYHNTSSNIDNEIK